MEKIKENISTPSQKLNEVFINKINEIIELQEEYADWKIKECKQIVDELIKTNPDNITFKRLQSILSNKDKK